ncbi:MAG: protein TolR [SAR324 cluster bacterium]|uniref:Protein TolR n=1 Tax=SAR324 cluster bacterium TaxID=2024889 RepID=A0A2A4T376_9DELT|nr:MAG: protein TolR [SAR324 cluster bacterium]
MLQPDKNSFEPISEINVTPFVDVLLVLLVIFMVTAPLFTKAIDVKLPEENLRSSAVKDARQFVITINRNGKFHIQGRRYSLENLKKIVVSWNERNPGKTAFIRADQRVRYGQITSLMVTLKNSGVQNLGLLVKDKLPKS